MPAKRRQCKTCPWKADANPFNIPGEYSPAKHRALRSTIAWMGELPDLDADFHVMACHETPSMFQGRVVGKELPCVGWLHNQLNSGNNILLRLRVSRGIISAEYELDGEQHPDFDATVAAIERFMPEGE